jgi:hypothetical protein
MQYVLYAVFEAGADIDPLFNSLHQKGFNGTYLPGASLNTLLHSSKEEEPSFLSLRSALTPEKKNNATFFLVVKEEQFSQVRKIIEDYTDSFKKIRGGLFAWPLSFFEGSF